jgi:hypothetical protein
MAAGRPHEREIFLNFSDARGQIARIARQTTI